MPDVTSAFARLADTTWRGLVLTVGRRSLGRVSGSSIVDWAVNAMVAGWDSLSLSVIAGLSKPPNEFEVDRYLSSMKSELKLDLPESVVASGLYAQAVAQEIVSGGLAAYEGAKEMHALWLASGCPDGLVRWSFLEDEFELARDGIYGRVEDVEREIIHEATRLLSAHERGSEPSRS